MEFILNGNSEREEAIMSTKPHYYFVVFILIYTSAMLMYNNF